MNDISSEEWEIILTANQMAVNCLCYKMLCCVRLIFVKRSTPDKFTIKTNELPFGWESCEALWRNEPLWTKTNNNLGLTESKKGKLNEYHLSLAGLDWCKPLLLWFMFCMKKND